MLYRGSNRSQARAVDGRVMRRGIIDSCQSAATSRIVKALLATSPTHVSSAIASSQPLVMLQFSGLYYLAIVK